MIIMAIASISDKPSNICNSSKNRSSRVGANNLRTKAPVHRKEAKGHFTEDPEVSAYSAMITAQSHEVGH